MLMPSIFGENLFNDDGMNVGFPEVDKALYGKQDVYKRQQHGNGKYRL